MFPDLSARIQRALERIGGAESSDAIQSVLYNEAVHHGFEGVTWSWIAQDRLWKAGGNVSNVLIDNFQKLRLDRYGPVTRRIRESPDPFEWSEVKVDAKRDPLGYRVMRIAAEAGLEHALTVPIYGDGHPVGTVNFIGRPHLSPEARKDLQVLAIAGHRALSNLPSATLSQGLLTAREREVLEWTARGKTALDVSMILGVSHRTVAFHLENASRKLGTVNRVHTVVEALRRQEIGF